MAVISQRVERMVAVLGEEETVLDAARLMTEKRIGSVVVTSASTVCGIFTERDLMKLVVRNRREPDKVRLRDVMRRSLITVGPADTVEHCLSLMRENQCRHLLVFEGQEFVGIVSMRDLVLVLLEEKQQLIDDLTRYING